jgi:hypothetical protein
MIGIAKACCAAAVLAATTSLAGATPVANGLGETLGEHIVRVHGDHRSCERGGGGWHRHNRYGERRPCREWRGEGRRPDYCVRVGRAWFCDY